ncbi:NAD-dependent epimerase/dehydratase family protein [Streptomyces sp. NPDC017435]|uniref:NAD-dependent epimerase/dehydratase family protein n=1 Tax=Streptomyces sp. NPDC017435 TaxID=3364995 RepID=UPI00378C6CD3
MTRPAPGDRAGTGAVTPPVGVTAPVPACGALASEDAPLRPTVPYAASKAASDLIALNAFRTHGLDVCVTRPSNTYGPAQPNPTSPWYAWSATARPTGRSPPNSPAAPRPSNSA